MNFKIAKVYNVPKCIGNLPSKSETWRKWHGRHLCKVFCYSTRAHELVTTKAHNTLKLNLEKALGVIVILKTRNLDDAPDEVPDPGINICTA